MSNPIYSIYTITNLVNGKMYVGYTSQNPPSIRWTNHIRQSKSKGKGHLYDAMRKYGEASFLFSVIYQSMDQYHTLTIMEPFFIKECNTFGENGYNMTYGGEGQKGNKSRTGMPHSQSSILKCSENRKGKGTGNRNGMKQPGAVEKIRLSRTGTKKHVKPDGTWCWVSSHVPA